MDCNKKITYIGFNKIYVGKNNNMKVWYEGGKHMYVEKFVRKLKFKKICKKVYYNDRLPFCICVDYICGQC